MAINWNTPTGDYDKAIVTAPLGAWSLVQVRLSGGVIQARANGGAWVSKSTVAIEDVSAIVSIGLFDGIPPADYAMAEIGLSKTAFDDATFDAIRGYVNNRYALSV